MTGLPPKKCQVCGKPFLPRAYHVRTCGTDECRLIIAKPKNCRGCGADFKPSRFYQRTCGAPECKRVVGLGHMRWPRVPKPKHARPLPCAPIPGHEEDMASCIERGIRQKRTSCRLYAQCLDYACGENWDAWTCGGCEVSEPMSAVEWHEELIGMAGLLKAVFEVEEEVPATNGAAMSSTVEGCAVGEPDDD